MKMRMITSIYVIALLAYPFVAFRDTDDVTPGYGYTVERPAPVMTKIVRSSQ